MNANRIDNVATLTAATADPDISNAAMIGGNNQADTEIAIVKPLESRRRQTKRARPKSPAAPIHHGEPQLGADSPYSGPAVRAPSKD